MTVEFGLLGSVEARVDGRIVDLGHARQRCVLAVLLRGRRPGGLGGPLVDRVWADRPPQRVRNTLYGYLSRLRQALAVAEGADIVRRSGGYVLEVEATAVDLHRFHDVTARARAAARNERDEQAATLFGQALGLWRGNAFAGLDTPWINALRDAVDQERIAAELDHTDVRLRRGHHTGLLAELSARVESTPWTNGWPASSSSPCTAVAARPTPSTTTSRSGCCWPKSSAVTPASRCANCTSGSSPTTPP